MKLKFSIPVAIFAGIAVLLGYFLPFPFFRGLQAIFLRWAIFLAAIALLLGIWNLTKVHLRRTFSAKSGWGYSFLLVSTLWLTFLVVLVFGLQNDVTIWIVRYLQIPLEASLAGVVVFVLLAGGARLLLRRPGWMSAVFLVTALAILLAAVPLPILPPDQLQMLEDVRSTLASAMMVLASAGGRGILIGMALGAAATGLRVLLGIDRPYER